MKFLQWYVILNAVMMPFVLCYVFPKHGRKVFIALYAFCVVLKVIKELIL